MKKHKIVWILLLAAFLVPMGFNGIAFTAPFVPPAWFQKLDGSQRWTVSTDGTYVLDKETGLVWERSPDTTVRVWSDAIAYAYNLKVGGLEGWRLPTAAELASLVDTTQSHPALPSGHPFIGVVSGGSSADVYWTATTSADNTRNSWYIMFDFGVVNNADKSFSGHVWYVRGRQGYDGW